MTNLKIFSYFQEWGSDLSRRVSFRTDYRVCDMGEIM